MRLPIHPGRRRPAWFSPPLPGQRSDLAGGDEGLLRRPIGGLGNPITISQDVASPLVKPMSACGDVLFVVESYVIHTCAMAGTMALSVPGRGAIHLPPSICAVWLWNGSMCTQGMPRSLSHCRRMVPSWAP